MNHTYEYSPDAIGPLAVPAYTQEPVMNEDTFNTSMRKFLKTLGVGAQREIEKAVRQALADGGLKGNERLPAKATITIGGIKFTHEVDGTIELG
jgi:Family of unknown function (DUF6494)